MITIYVSCVRGIEPDVSRFLEGCKKAMLGGDKDKKKIDEKFSIPVSGQLEQPRILANSVFKHGYEKKISTFNLVGDRIELEETTERVVGWTRVWLGFNRYVLFWFRGDSAGKGYPYHRLLAAKCLLPDIDDLKQGIIVPIEYNLPCLQEKFPINIWDQDFVKDGQIKHGRIRGDFMETDPYWKIFSNIESYIGITIPTTGASNKVKVLTGGRLQLMGLQEKDLEDKNTNSETLEKIFEILDLISPCEEHKCGD